MRHILLGIVRQRPLALFLEGGGIPVIQYYLGEENWWHLNFASKKEQQSTTIRIRNIKRKKKNYFAFYL